MFKCCEINLVISRYNPASFLPLLQARSHCYRPIQHQLCSYSTRAPSRTRPSAKSSPSPQPPAPITYEMMEHGSIRKKVKLVSSEGYANNVKSRFQSTAQWQCAFRPKTPWGVLPYSLGGGVPLGSRKSYPFILGQILQIL